MPTKPPTPQPIVKITLVHGINTDLHMGSSFYQSYSGGTPTAAQLNALATSVGTAWNAQLAGLLSTDGLLESVTITDVANAMGATGVSTTTHAGTRSGHQPTSAACAQITFGIARKYRGGKPKIFLPFGIQSDCVTGAFWTTTFTNLVTAAWASFQAAVNGLTSGPITLAGQYNVSYFQGSTSNPNSSKWGRRNVPALRSTPALDAILTAQARQRISSQRRRIAAS